MRNKKNKGFTLIELLVVVAIIGILAAVGVVAYSGYTAGAKKQAAKSNQSAVVKYIAAEVQKCNLGTDTGKAMKDPQGTERLTCSGKTGKTVAAAAISLSLISFTVLASAVPVSLQWTLKTVSALPSISLTSTVLTFHV